MYYIAMDDRSNVGYGAVAGSCAKCCCEPIGLRPGETGLIKLNYAPWSVPYGGLGLLPNPEFTIVEDLSACNNPPIDGFPAPAVGNLIFNSPHNIGVNTPQTNDLRVDTYPNGQAYTYQLEPVSGPYNGVLSPAAIDGSNWTYTGNPGFNGWDRYYVRITDPQGRQIVRAMTYRVGTPSTPQPAIMQGNQNGLVVDRAKAVVDARMHTMQFPVWLSPGASCDTIDACKRWRVTIKQSTRDCDNIYDHISCIEFYCKKC